MAATQEVQGQRSPRWTVWARMEIPCRNGLQYLARLRIVQTPWFGVYLHDIFEPDGDRDPHNHPWPFISVVLRGHYIERVYAKPGLDPYTYIEKRHDRLSAHRMGRHEAHRIIVASPRLKTLILCGRRGAGWGFFQDGKYMPWQEYESQGGLA